MFGAMKRLGIDRFIDPTLSRERNLVVAMVAARLLECQGKIEQRLARGHLEVGSPVLYDLTSTYFEGRKCALTRHGYSWNGKQGK